MKTAEFIEKYKPHKEHPRPYLHEIEENENFEQELKEIIEDAYYQGLYDSETAVRLGEPTKKKTLFRKYWEYLKSK